MTDSWDTGEGGHGTIHRDGREKGEPGIPVVASVTIGWRPSCHHGPGRENGLPPVPCVVLDPFGGAATTALVARSAVMPS